MAQTIGFASLPSAHGGRGLMMAYGTVASLVTAGSFAAQLQTAGSNVLRNVQAPIVTVANAGYGTGIVLETIGSSNGYVTVTLWDLGTGEAAKAHAGTVDLNFILIGGGGSI